MSQTVQGHVEIVNKLGLHARPATMFVETASQCGASVRVRRSDSNEYVDGKSIMQLMMLAATKGTELEITAEGGDADKAVASLIELVQSGFLED